APTCSRTKVPSSRAPRSRSRSTGQSRSSTGASRRWPSAPPSTRRATCSGTAPGSAPPGLSPGATSSSRLLPPSAASSRRCRGTASISWSPAAAVGSIRTVAIDPSRRRVVVVMPAYNAGRTLRLTYEELPKDTISTVILVDDGSTDATLEIARELGLEVFVHNRNYGYGANQKTCYTEALRARADIVVMVHPDYQYDPTLLPQMIEPIVDGAADVVLGSRLKSGSALAQGMPWWKFAANRFLTWAENRAFRLQLSEYHTGYRAFSREVLETVNFRMNSD